MNIKYGGRQHVRKLHKLRYEAAAAVNMDLRRAEQCFVIRLGQRQGQQNLCSGTRL